MADDPQVMRSPAGIMAGLTDQWGYITFTYVTSTYVATNNPTGVGYAYIFKQRVGGHVQDEQRAYWSFANVNFDLEVPNYPGDIDVIETDKLYFRITVVSAPIVPPGESLDYRIGFSSGKDIIGATLTTAAWGQMPNAGGVDIFGASAPSGDKTYSIANNLVADFVVRDGDQDVEIYDATAYTWGVTGGVLYRIQHSIAKAPFTFYDGHDMDWKRIEQHFARDI